MAEIVNLRRTRKAKAKQAEDAKAEANRIQFGRTKAEKQLSAAAKSRADGVLDGHKIGDPPEES